MQKGNTALNELEKRASRHKKKQKGMSPFTTLDGDPKINADSFNDAMGTSSTASGTASGGCAESLEPMTVGEALETLNSINESSVNRFKHHIESENPIAIVSAYRSDKSKAENEANDRELRKFARMEEVEVASGSIKSLFGFVRTSGGYAESGVRGINEMSIALIADKGREQELLDFAIAVGERYEQDSILFIPSNGDAYYISTNDDDNNWVGKKGNKFNLGRKMSSDKSDIDKVGGFTQISRKKRNVSDNDLFVIGEDFNIDNDFSTNTSSISNKVCSNRLKSCIKRYGKFGVSKYLESFTD